MPPSVSLCTFHLGDFLFGVEATRVQEVLRGPKPAPVPLAPSWVAGQINLRGQVLTVLNLKKRMGLPEPEPGSAPYCVILKDRGECIGLLVDDIGDVMEPSPDSFEPPPVTIPAETP